MKSILILACILAAGSARAQQTLRLLDSVNVSGENVSLSDLLPPNASAALRSAAGKIVLGRSPQAGSVRVFTASEIRQVIGGTFELQFPERIIVRRSGWPLRVETLRQLLERSNLLSGFDWSKAQILSPPEFTTAEPDPQLEATGIRTDHGRVYANLRCRRRRDCGSFAAEITFPRSKSDSFLDSTSTLRSAVLIPRSGAGGFPPVPPVLVRPKQLALLVIEAHGLRVTEPVMPQTPGRIGEMVRVTDPVSHRSLFAEVVGSGRLRPASAPGENRQEPR